MADDRPPKRQRTSPPPSLPPIQNRNQSPPQSPPRMPAIQAHNQSLPPGPPRIPPIRIRNRTNIDWGLYNRHPPVKSYSEYLMTRYKLFPCEKTHNHDQDACPFKHAGDPAARRDPILYTPELCANFLTSHGCYRGDNCQRAHGDFERGLHPNYYRTRQCGGGLNCTLPFCFDNHGWTESRYFYGHDIPGQPVPRLGLGLQAPIPGPEPEPAPSGLTISPLTREALLRDAAHAYTRIEGRQGSTSQTVQSGDNAGDQRREDTASQNVETGDSQASTRETPEESHSDEGSGED